MRTIRSRIGETMTTDTRPTTTTPTPGATRLPGFASDPSLKLLLFGGKGGVGKTTLATTTALHRARANPAGRVILVSTDPAHSAADAIAGDALPDNLELVEFDADAAHRAFVDAHRGEIKELATRGTFMDESDADSFVDLSVPGLDELMAFLQIARWLEEDEPPTIVVDTAPTGHTLRLLRMPEFLDGWLGALDALLAKHRYMASIFGGAGEDSVGDLLAMLGSSFEHLEEVLTDPARARFVPVMIAEKLSACETTRLLDELTRHEVPAGEVVVNRLMPEGGGAFGAQVRAAQMRALQQLPTNVLDNVVWGVPLLADETRGDAVLGHLFESMIPPGGIMDMLESAGLDGVHDAPPPSVERGCAELPRMDAGVTPLILFAGKGGVGKTTMACAAAITLAERAQGRGLGDVLAISTDPAHSLGDCFDAALSDEPTEVAPGLNAVELNAASAFAELQQAYADEIAAALGAMFENVTLAFDEEAMQSLLDLAPPGLDELMALLRVIDELETNEHAAIVLDTAPTGHLLRLLELPELVEQWLKGIFALLLKYDDVLRLPGLKARLVEISRGVKRLRGVMADGDRCMLTPVAIPTILSREETGDLLGSCRALGVRTGGVIVNQVTPAGEDALLRALAARESRAIAEIEGLEGASALSVVLRGCEPRGVEALRELGAALFASGGAQKRSKRKAA
jgi:arsenite-transporting ATPase